MSKVTRPKRVRARTKEWAGRPGGPCAACGNEVSHLEIDHIVPFFENGRHHLSNIQWLCHSCHVEKSTAEVRRHRLANPELYERPMTDAGKQRVSEFFRGRPRSPEHQEKISEGLRRAWAKKTPEERAAIAEKGAEKQRGRVFGPMPEEQRRKIADAQRLAWASGKRKRNPEDAGEKLAEASRLWWEQATPEQRAQRGAAISAGRRKSD